MPLLHCMLAPDAAPGELYEPEGGGGMSGLPRHVPLAEAQCRCDADAEALLWRCSEAAVGPFPV